MKSTLLMALAGATLLVSGAMAQPVVMRISHQVPPAHHMSEMLDIFAADVKARTGGSVEVQLYGSEQLAKATENFPQVARGAIEAGMVVNTQWGKTIPETSALSIPFFFTDLARIEKFPGSDARRYLDELVDKRGVKNIAWVYITRLSAFTSSAKPLITIADFKGIKLRGLNALVDTAFVAVGAAPSALPGPEVYQALQSGVLDAGLTDLSAAVSRKWYEVQKYATVSPFFAVYFQLFVNPGWWGKLKPEQQSAIMAAAAAMERNAIPITEKTAAAAIGQLRDKGMTLHIQIDAEVAQWKGAMQGPVIAEFLKSAPEGGKKIIELMGAL